MKLQYRTVAELLGAGEIPHRVLIATAGSALAQQMGMVMLGDYVSYYLALLQGIDPSPTPTINRGKQLSTRSLPNGGA